jgi:hypothetical protein
MTNRTRLVSGRVVTSNSANVPSDRYQYLDLSSAEPNLGTANVGDVLVYDTAYPGARRWIPQTNISGSVGQQAFDKANAAYAQANVTIGVDATQNTRLLVAEGTDASQNVRLNFSNTRMDLNDAVNTSQNVRLNFSNTRMDLNDAVNTSQNVRLDFSNTRMTIIDGVDASQNVRLNFSNTAIAATDGKMQSAYNQANTGTVLAQAAYNQANVTIGVDVTQNTNIASTDGKMQSAYNQANTGTVLAQASYNQANVTIGVDATQNTAIAATDGKMQSAYNKANTGGLFSGDVTISGNLIVNGVTTTVNTSTVTTTDSLIKLANNNISGDSVDIGFYGTYNSSGQKYAGLVRQAGSNFFLFKDITTDPTSNSLPIGSLTGSNTGILNANVIGYITSNGYSLYDYVNSVFNLANTHSNQITVIQGTNTTQNTNIAATDGKMQSAYNQANTGTVLAQAVYNQANVTIGVDATQNTAIAATDGKMQSAYNQANTGTVLAQASYNQANVIIGVNATQNTAIAATDGKMQSAYGQANTGTVLAQAAFDKANTGATSSGYLANSVIFANSTGHISNTSSFQYISANNTLITGNIITTGSGGNISNANVISANTFVATSNIISAGIDLLSYTQSAFNSINVQIQVDNTQNTRLIVIEDTNASQNVRLNFSNTRMDISDGVDASQNVRLDYSNTAISATDGKMQSAYNQANTGTVLAQASYNQANVTIGVDATQNTKLTVIEGTNASQNVRLDFSNTAITATDGKMQSAYNQANTGTFLAQAAYNQANVTVGVDATQNTRLTVIEGTNASQNVSINAQNNSITIIQGVNDGQNTLIQTVFNQANVGHNFVVGGGTVSGNVSIQGNLEVTGNVSVIGNVTNLVISGNSGQFFGNNTTGFEALYAGIAVGYNFQPQTIYQMSGDYDGYVQTNIQNINAGQDASSDVVATADNGSEADGFIDMGIGSSNYNDPDFELHGPNDGYLYVHGNTATGGGNLVFSTRHENDIIFSANGLTSTDEIARFKYDEGLILNRFPITFDDGTKQNTAASPINYTQAAFNTANSASANTIIIQGVDASQNIRLDFSNTAIAATDGKMQSAYNQANNVTSASGNTIVIQGVDEAQNARIAIIENVNLSQNVRLDFSNTAIAATDGKMQSAYNQANTSATSSGYRANTIIVANSAGFLSNSNVFFVAANNNFIVSGNVQVLNGNLTTRSTELTLSQTGDVYGATYLRLQNREGLNGALFDGSLASGVSNALVDFGFKTINGQRNIRFETRSGFKKISTGDGLEFQIGEPDTPTLVTSNNSVAVLKTTRSTSNTTGALTVSGGVGITGNLYSGNIVITGITSNGITFADGTRQITAGSGIDQWVRDTANVAIGVDASQNVRLDFSNTAIAATDGKMQSAYNQANTGTVLAQAAYNQANVTVGVDATQNTNIANKLSLTGAASQTVTGNVVFGNDLTVTGNLIVLGNTVSLNVTSIESEDSLIQLGVGNYTTDVLSIGYIGHYNDGTNAQAGFIRDASTKEFYAFQGYTPEATGNVININAASFAKANIQGNWFKGNLIAATARVGGLDIGNFTTAAFNQANTGTVLAQAAFDAANVQIGVDATQNTRLIVSEGVDLSQNVSINTQNSFITIIQGVDDGQNTRMTIIEGTDTSQNARITIIEGVDVTQNTRLTVSEGVVLSQNVRLDYSNTAIVATDGKMQSAYNQANTGTVLAQAAFDAANTSAGTIGYTAWNKANGAYDQANTGTVLAQAAYNQANVTIGVDASQNVRLDFSNTRMAISDGVDASQNVRLDFSNTAINATDGKMQSAYNTANTADVRSAAAYFHANGAFIRANAAYDFANTITTFGSIKVSGQPDVIANVTESQLTFVAGSGMTITTVGTSNTITFSSTGGASLSGYLANTVVVANASGFLSNSNVFFTASNNTLATSNVYVSNRVGFANANNILVVYQVYNANTNSLDTIFG